MALTATIDAQGISAPDYPSILAQIQSAYRSIYGSDVYLEPDSQDGQFLALLSLAISDCNSMAIAVYNNESPATAFGEGLSSVVKINGLARQVPSYSTVDLTIGGTVGTVLVNAAALDLAGNSWVIQGTVTIPPSGTVIATAQAAVLGAVTAAAGTISQIGTPMYGWQTVTNMLAALPGAPVESDAALRQRQSVSTALPSLSILSGITGSILALPGVLRVASYENDTGVTDANGVPSHSLAFVVDGGVAQDIANTIGARKGPGSGTFGTTSLTVYDFYNVPRTISFFRPSVAPIAATITIKALAGYTTAMGAAIVANVAAYINGLAIAAPVRLTRVYPPIDAAGDAFYVTGLTLGRVAGPQAAADVTLGFTEAASADLANITLIVT